MVRVDYNPCHQRMSYIELTFAQYLRHAGCNIASSMFVSEPSFVLASVSNSVRMLSFRVLHLISHHNGIRDFLETDDMRCFLICLTRYEVARVCFVLIF